jgi:hypothetical protein
VTGSSGTPAAGAKNRETKSKSFTSDGAVTITPRTGIWASAERSGCRARSVAACGDNVRGDELRGGDVRGDDARGDGAAGVLEGAAGGATEGAAATAAKRPRLV